MNTLPSTTEIQRILAVYGYTAGIDYAERTRAYVDLLLRWNRKVALTTVTEPQEVVKFHFGESLFGMITAEVQNGRLADLGSGAGFPGAPIAMAKPAVKVTLVESNGKKAAFLNEVRRELRLQNLTVHHGRAEELAPGDQFEFVTARALGDHQKWLGWSSDRVVLGGKVVFWVSSEPMEEIRRVGHWHWAQTARIPETKDRFVIVGIKED